MGKTAILSVRILGDAKGAVSAMGEAEGKASKLGGLMKGIGGAVLGAATVAGGALVALGVSGVKAAGELEQSIGAVDSVFKGGADQVHAFADTAATELGLTGNEYRELATLMGTQLKNGGTSLEELGGKTHELMGLGADLASMFGGSTADAVGAISSALKGERDPIEQFGVSLKQATIDARAAELGFQKVGGSLSDEAQQAATLSLIMDQTADAHGNFGRETNTFAGQVSILTAQWGNFTAQIGMLLLPVLTTLLTFVTGSVMPGLQALADVVGPQITAAIGQVAPMLTGLIDGFTGVADGASPLQGILGMIMPALAGIGQAVIGFLPTLMTFGQTLLPLIAGAIMQIVPTLVSIAGAVIPAIISILQSALPVIANIASAVIPAIISAIQTLVPMLLQIIPPIVSIVQTVIGILAPAIQWLLPLVTGIFGALVTQITGAIQIIVGVLNTVAAVLRGDWAGAWRGIQQIVGGVMTFIRGLIQQGMTWIAQFTGQSVAQVRNTFTQGFAIIRDRVASAVQTLVMRAVGLITGLVGAMRSRVAAIRAAIVDGINTAKAQAIAGFTALVTGVTGKITSLVGRVKALPGQIKSALGNLGSLLRSAGRDLIQGLINGIGSMGSALKNKASNLAGGAVSSIKSKLGIASPSKVMRQVGVWTGEGLIQGVERMQHGAGRAMAGLVDVPDTPRIPLTFEGRRTAAAPAATEVHVHIEGAFVGDRIGLAREIEQILADRRTLIGAA